LATQQRSAAASPLHTALGDPQPIVRGANVFGQFRFRGATKKRSIPTVSTRVTQKPALIMRLRLKSGAFLHSEAVTVRTGLKAGVFRNHNDVLA
jgi:hypothetical protein